MRRGHGKLSIRKHRVVGNMRNKLGKLVGDGCTIAHGVSDSAEAADELKTSDMGIRRETTERGAEED